MFTQLCLEHTKNENKQLKYTILYIQEKNTKPFLYKSYINRIFLVYTANHIEIATYCNIYLSLSM